MPYDDPEKIKEAKSLAAGPLGEQLAKYPLLFSKAAFLGERPAENKSTLIRNGTVTLLDLGTGPIAITCAHIIACYREFLETFGCALFQVGNVELDPLSQLIAENDRLDLATIRLTLEQAESIKRGGEIGSSFFQPVSWPPPLLKEGEFIAFGGFPELWRERKAFDELVFPSFSSGACMITTIAEDRFTCQFERQYWVKSFNIDNREDLHLLSGMSGGPAFIHRGLYWDFAGVIYGFSSGFDIMLLRPANLFYPDGSINGPRV